MNAKLVLMIGIPGSGKSTYAKRRFMGKENAYISRDEIRFSMVKEDEEYFSKEKEVFDEFVKQIDKALVSGYRYVIADATHLNKASRSKLLSRLTHKPEQIIGMYMDTPLMLAIMRNNEREGRAVVPETVIKNMYNSLQLPTAEEDMDLVTIKTEYNGERGENMIYFTSDSHFCHDREFLYGERGFISPQEMNEEIIKRWNKIVKPDDEVYHLGDIMLNDVDAGIDCLNRLNGKIHIIRGNHDTDAKVERYKDCRNVVSIEWSTMLKIGKRYFYLSHFPSITKTPEDSPNKQGIINLHGHTHQTENFGKDGNFYLYHVGMDSHDLKPVSIDQVIEDIAAQRQKYYEQNI